MMSIVSAIAIVSVLGLVGAAILVVQIVGVFPHVKTQKWFQSGAYGVTAVSFFGDMQFTVLVY